MILHCARRRNDAILGALRASRSMTVVQRSSSGGHAPAGRGEQATELDAFEPAPQGAGVSAGASAYLVVRGAGGARVIDLADGSTTVLGRAPDADVVVDDTRASRRHALVRRAGAVLWLEDLGSRNGTRLNGAVVRAERRRLNPGDLVRVADCEAVVVLSSETPPRDTTVRAPGADEPSGPIVVADPAMDRLLQLARRLALVDTSVLVVGETGVGKEVMAREIHAHGPRAAGPWVRVNCPSLPDTLLESELFGFERGAFTGADRAKVGYVESAHRGTLLLDEIGDLPLRLQVKLLCVLENRCVQRLGSTREIPVDVRVVSATNRDLREEVAQGRLREDLFYRISAFTLRIPPLRERPAEIAPLAALFARRCAARMGLGPPAISPQAAEALARHAWPGNARELRNAMEHAMVLADGPAILPEHLPESTRAAGGVPGGSATAGGEGTMRESLSQIERAQIEGAPQPEGGNQTRAARRLGTSRRALIYPMHKYGIAGA
jgi:DNA-binding NtrC family response regulator